jgi:sugar lactone lactonase YvrE
MSVDLQCVVKTRAILGESVLWHPAERRIYWLDLKAPAVHIYDPATGAADSWRPELGIPMGTLVRARDGFVLSGREGVFKLDMASRRIRRWVDPNDRQEITMFNDGKVDRQGRLWLCTSDVQETEPLGGIYRLDPDGHSVIQDRGSACGNGPAFSRDGRTLYFADTMTRKVYAYDLDPASGRLGERREFVTFPEAEGMPDGMTVDADDHVWICQWGGAGVSRFTPGGKLDFKLELPCPLVTSCAFAGDDLDTLYVTTATVDMDAATLAVFPLAGSLFAARTGHRGLPEPVFGVG